MYHNAEAFLEQLETTKHNEIVAVFTGSEFNILVETNKCKAKI